MSSALRRRLAAGLLVAVMAWPGIQHVLARSLELDPWAFFGFAMYAVPNLRVNVRAAGLAEDGGEPDWNAIPVSSYRLLNDYAEARARYGLLLPPDALADQLFERHPQIEALLIRVRRWRISPETHRLEPLDRDRVYRRLPAS